MRGCDCGQLNPIADGEVALEKTMRDALPFALFTNDFMHTAGCMKENIRCG